MYEYVAKFAQDCFVVSPDGKKIEVRVAPALETMLLLDNLRRLKGWIRIDFNIGKLVELGGD
ncbi:MAG: hypothetical protein Kow0049_23840 [Stanieria sp.]